MIEHPRYLITTSDERTWYHDRPVLFLGEWCRIYERQGLWQDLDAKVVPPYGWGDGQKDADFAYVQQLYEILLVELSDALNQYHSVNHSLRYWRILIGPWLHTFTNVLFNRWSAIQLAFQNFEIAGTLLLDFPEGQMVPNSQSEFEQLILGHQWNHHIYGRILSGWTNCQIEKKIAPILVEGIFDRNHKEYVSVNRLIRRFITKGLDLLSGLLSFHKDAFFINTYLPRKQDLLLQIALGQIPKLWQTPKEPKVAPSLQIRKELRMSYIEHNGFEHCIRILIVEQIPSLYLEGYQTLKLRASKMFWPKNPKVIFTANSAHQDEIFKAWTAEKVESGTPYVYGQHGGLYGTGKFPTQFEIREVETADRFLTWGWTDGNPKHYPSVASTIVGKPSGTWNPNGGLLQVNYVAYRYSRDPWEITNQQAEYLEEQFRFVERLPEKIYHHLLVRLSRGDKSYGFPQKKKWKVRHPNVRLDEGNSSIDTLIRQSRIFVYTYNSTGFLETLSRNIPTIMYWNPLHWELRPSAQPYFDRLAKVGILHFTPESAADKIASIWDNVDEWWCQDEIQEALIYFCDQFAILPANPIQVLKFALLSTI